MIKEKEQHKNPRDPEDLFPLAIAHSPEDDFVKIIIYHTTTTAIIDKKYIPALITSLQDVMATTPESHELAIETAIRPDKH